jgi:5-deoxy-glucuronate isomerase
VASRLLCADAMPTVEEVGVSLHLKGVTEITPESAGWTYTGLKIVTLGRAQSTVGDRAAMSGRCLPLAGLRRSRGGGRTIDAERPGVRVRGVSDFRVRAEGLRVPADGQGRFALAHAPAPTACEVAYGAPKTSRSRSAAPALHAPAEQLPRPRRVPRRPPRLRRGAHARGQLVLLSRRTSTTSASETEAELEEIYYFEVKGEHGYGIHRTYTADARSTRP